MSRTNIELDDSLVKTALKLTKIKTKKQLVHRALEELVKRERRKGILNFEGKVPWEGSLSKARKGRTWSL